MNNLPTGPLTILGDAVPGNTLIARPNAVVDKDGMGVQRFQWLRDGKPIGGSTEQRYIVSDEDVGHKISVDMSYVDGQGNSELVHTHPNDIQTVYGPDAPTLTFADIDKAYKDGLEEGYDQALEHVSEMHWIAALYVEHAYRVPDAPGFEAWLGAINAGIPKEQIRAWVVEGLKAEPK